MDKKNNSFKNLKRKITWILIILCLLFIAQGGLRDIKELAKWNLDWSDRVRLIGLALLVPLGVKIQRTLIGHEFSKYEWWLVFLLAVFGVSAFLVAYLS